MSRRLSLLVLVLAGCAPAEQPRSVRAASVSAGNVYTFGALAGATGSCLDVSGNGSADRTTIQEWTCNGSAAQSFRVDDLGGGAARLVHVASGKCVDVDGAGSADGTRIQLYTCNGTGAQSFQIGDAGGGTVRFVNGSSGKCIDVSGQGTADGTKVQLWTCNGTRAQQWQPSGGSAPPPPPPPPPPGKIVAGYYPNWPSAPPRIRDVDARYNLIYLFAATPVGGAPGTTGAVEWTPPGDGAGAASNLNADIQYARSVQGRKILLTVGGAGNGMSFPTRAKSQTFVDSVTALVGSFGGLDGLDWNTFEGSQAPDTGEMIWISQQLKARFPGFLITAPPAPWNSVDQAFCQAMVAAGALDLVAPQYYDGPNLATVSYAVGNVDTWVGLVGAEHLLVGFGVWNQPNYWSIGDAISAWNQIVARHPTIAGAFDWNIDLDQGAGWPFAEQLGPLVH